MYVITRCENFPDSVSVMSTFECHLQFEWYTNLGVIVQDLCKNSAPASSRSYDEAIINRLLSVLVKNMHVIFPVNFIANRKAFGLMSIIFSWIDVFGFKISKKVDSLYSNAILGNMIE